MNVNKKIKRILSGLFPPISLITLGCLTLMLNHFGPQDENLNVSACLTILIGLYLFLLSMEKNNDYLRWYLNFLTGEIPSTIPIITFTSILAFLLKSNLVIFSFSLIIISVLFEYLLRKYEKYFIEEIANPISFFNRQGLDIKKVHAELYIGSTSIIFFLLIEFLNLLISNHK